MIIYKITNTINKKIYIGQTIRELNERIQEHKRKNGILQKAFKKYGFENFEIEIIEKCKTTKKLNEREIYWIKHYNCLHPYGYNLCEGGGQTNGFKHSEESKCKMSATQKYLKNQNGEKNHFYGKHHTEETIEKMRKTKLGRKLSDEWKQKIGLSCQKKVVNIDTGEVFNSVKEAAQKYNLKDTHISRVCKGKRKRTGGFKWGYFDKTSIHDNTVPSLH